MCASIMFTRLVSQQTKVIIVYLVNDAKYVMLWVTVQILKHSYLKE